MKYRKKPVIVEAYQYKEEDSPGVMYEVDQNYRPYVTTIHGQKTYIEVGDYIIMEPDGIHFYPCKPDIFENSYKLVQ